MVDRIIKKVFPTAYTRIFDEGYLKAEKDAKKSNLTNEEKDWYHWKEERKREIAIRDSK